ncbi:cyclic peptide export ABC transporter [Shimia sp.]|uniref:cyclic peptide export ABC transporter n=1 Tax=Shimia sp. TaxID=1954381 RepID=UPI0032985E1A
MSEADVSIEFREIPPPEEAGLKALTRRRLTVLRFLTVTSGVVRDPIVIVTLVASLSRTGMIFGINETAKAAGQGFGWSIWLLIVSAIALVISSYYKRLRAFYLITSNMAKLRERMARRLLRANVDFLLSSKHGQVYASMTHEVAALSGAVLNVIEALEAFVVLAIAVPYLFYVSWTAGVAAVVTVIIGMLGYILLDLPARRHNLIASELFATYCDRVGDMLSGWRELRQRGTRRQALERETLDVIEQNMDHRLKSEKLYTGSAVVGQTAVILLLCFVVIAIPVLQGGDTTTMFQVLTIVFLTNGPIELMFNMMPRLSRAENAYYKLQQTEQSLSTAQSRSLMADHPANESFESIELKGVEAQVRELEKPDAEVFHLGPIDLSFRPGETVFICGGNGSGKTTLLSLITGLRHPEKGEILLDGDPLNEESTSGYRELFTGVFSGFHLFERAYGMNDEELAELERRIAQLGLSERVQMREDRFSSTSLSAGQSRRLALAVALAEQRRIIVLDEFAADQDPANRAFFYDVLVPELSASGGLVLAVTHDDHQFHKCDRLIKMDSGRVISDTRQNGRSDA